jgi:hypothetical protein
MLRWLLRSFCNGCADAFGAERGIGGNSNGPLARVQRRCGNAAAVTAVIRNGQREAKSGAASATAVRLD